ncbi:MAG: SURF1 family protein [Gammaproteobacteria bacterium]
MKAGAGKWRLWLVTAAMVAFVIACAWLAAWQYRRAHERAARIAAVETARKAPPAKLDPARLAALPRYTHVYADGHYQGGRQSLLMEMTRPRSDRVGAEILTPLVLPSGKLLLVNRGWVYVDGEGRVVANLAAPAGTVRAAGFLAPLPRPGLHLGGNPTRMKIWPARLLFPGWAELDRLYGPRLLHRQLLLEPGAPGGFYRGWQMRPGHSPAQNYSYMAQWSVFALIALGLWLWFIPRRLRRARSGE